MDETLLPKILSSLDIVVIEQSEDGSFEILGTVPEWFEFLFLEGNKGSKKLIIDDESSFLGSFVIDAAKLWEKKREGQALWSGFWEETLESGENALLEAGAIYLEDRKILMVRSFDNNGTTYREAIQHAREELLAYENLAMQEKEIEKYKDFLEQEVKKRTLQVEKTLEGVTNAIMAITEMRDPYTAGHQRRVAQLACAIAREMGRPEQEIDGLYIAGTLHDIGKIYVPAEILSKPGNLSDLEIKVIRAHCQAGWEILKNIEFPRPIADIVLQHHENIDGSGYPCGLSGESILLKARILRVADVVEAMSSHRPYRPARGTDKALEEIEMQRGILYDSNVVDACLRLFREKHFQF